ncbi:MAG: hypothetical protein ACOYNR_12540 [Blastocatellia bacterium]
MLFCPRCAMQQTETTKFCRGCGLSMTEVVQYVQGGGKTGLPASIQGPIDTFNRVYRVAELPPQKSEGKPSALSGLFRLLHSAWGALSPRQKMVLSILATVMSTPILGVLGADDELIGLSALLSPLVIIFWFFYFRNQARQQASTALPDPQRGEPLFPPAASLPLPSTNELRLSEPPREQTHPFPGAVPSVVEDETRRF